MDNKSFKTITYNTYGKLLNNSGKRIAYNTRKIAFGPAQKAD